MASAALLLAILGAVSVSSVGAQYYGCSKLDIVFLVDSSSNVRGIDDWEKVQRFTTTVIAAMNGQQVNVKFALATYSQRSDVVFDFNTYRDELDISRAIENSRFDRNSRSANLVDGLETVRNRLIGSSSNRPDAANIIIIVTSGTLNNLPSRAAATVRDLTGQGVTIMSVALRSDAPIPLLESIASAKRYAVLAMDLQLLATLLPSTLSVPCPVSSGNNNCGLADIAFVVDSSGSINDADPGNWRLVTRFLSDVTKQLAKLGSIRFGTVVFSNRAETVFNLEGYNNMNELLANLASLKYIGGTTNVADGLEKARTEVLSPSQVRPGAFKIIILMTDGKPNERVRDTLSEAQRTKDQNIRIIPIGVTNAIDLDLLRLIANNPRNVLTSPDFTFLTSQVANIVSLACGTPAPPVVVTPGDCRNADIVFIIDSSGSIKQTNPVDWDLVLQFLRDAIRGLSQISSNIRFGMVTFSYEARLVFDFNRYSNVDDVIRAVNDIPYIGSTTDIADGFQMAREKILVGARRDAAKIAILMTDGKPNSRVADTEPEARRVKDLGVRVVAIGVTKSIDEPQLRRIASTPDDVITTADFATLAGQVNDIVGVACSGNRPIPTPAPVRPRPPVNCRTADIVFIVDSSGSIKQTNPGDWDLVLNFLREAIQNLARLSNDIRFSIITFSYEARLVFDLNEYNNVNDVIRAVAGIPYIGSTTNIADGFEMARLQVLDDARSGAARVVILMTDGKPNSRVTETEPQADQIKRTGARLIAIGVTDSVDLPQLERVASTRDDVITSPDFQSLAGKVNDIVGIACGQQPAPRPVTPGGCGKADVMFLVDSSGSIKETNPADWDLVLDFLRNAIRGLARISNDIRFSIVTFSFEAQLVFDLNEYRDINDVINAIGRIPYIGSTTDITDGLQMIRTRVLPGARSDAGRILILMTDGKPNEQVGLTESEADAVKATGTRIVGIGVTRFIDEPQLRRIATTPSDVITTADFASLAGRVNDIIGVACGPTRPPRTPRPTPAPSPGLCGGADVVFIVDSSGSIKASDPRDWDLVLQFVREAIRGISGFGNDVRFAIVTFSYEARIVFRLSRYSNVNDAINAVATIPYINSITNIADALEITRTGILNETRSDAARIVILLTDGQPNSREADTEPQADLLKRTGARIISIGVTKLVDADQLRRIASSPNDVITTPDFTSLAAQVGDIVDVACGPTPIPTRAPTPAPSPTRDCGKADVMFLVDSSGSIKETNPADWDLVLDFLRNAIRGLARISNDIRFSIVTFSFEAQLVFDLNEYRDINDVINAIGRIPYIGSTTDITDGLQMIRTRVLPGARSDAGRILILMTDGKPNEQVGLTESEADAVKATGTRIVGIGVTRFIDEPQLRRIATTPSDVITTADFASLAGRVNDIIGVACGPTRPPRTPRPTPAPTPGLCGGADVVFIVDSSGSIKASDPRDWDLVLQFVREAIRGISGFGNDVRFAIVTFSYEARIVFRLSRYSNVNDAINAVATIPYINSITNIADALEITRTGILNETRSDAARIVILLTDGQPNSREADTEPQADLLKRTGARIISIGVTKLVDADQLRRIASSPNDVITTPDFTSLAAQVGDIVDVACGPTPIPTRAPTPAPSPTPGNCRRADIIFLVDSSGSIKETNPADWDLVLDFLRDAIRGLVNFSDDIRFSMVTFSNNAELVFDFTRYNDVSSVVNAVGTIPYIGGTTNIADGFNVARTVLIPQLRSDAKSILILMTDGKPNERVDQTEPEAELTKNTGTRVVAIGVTKSIDEQQLRRIATTQNDVITSPDFASLAGKVNDIIGVACGKPTTTIPKTPEPTTIKPTTLPSSTLIPTTTSPLRKDCGIADIIFLVDSSGSIKQTNPTDWDLALAFLRDTIQGLARISTDVRFAIITFSYEARLVFDLNEYTNVNDVTNGVSRIPYIGSTTNIADAFKIAREQVLPTGRPSSAKIIILMTDGKPNVKVPDTEPEAQRVKNIGVRVVSIGITDSVDQPQLERIATSPSDALTSPDFASLSSRVSDLVTAACPVPPAPRPTPGDCNVVDVALIVDSSGSIQEKGPNNWNLLLDFVRDLVRAISGLGDARFALVDFSDAAQLVFNLNDYPNTNGVLGAVQSMTYFGGRTNIAEALQIVRDRVIPQVRATANRIVILITDGIPNERMADTIPEARRLKATGSKVVTVGVTSDIDEALLEQIASSRFEALTSPDFTSLANQVGDVVGTACVTAPPPAIEPCGVVDITLVVDTSGSIQERDAGNWNLVLNFLRDVINTIGSTSADTRFAIVSFSDNAELVFNLNRYLNYREAVDGVAAIPYRGGRTNIADALSLARTTVLPQARRDAIKLVMLVTDGIPNEKEMQTLPEASMLKAVARVLSVGVTDQIDEDLLINIATTRQDVILSPDFSSLSGRLNNVISRACATVPPAPAPDSCNSADFMFVVDSSGSIQERDPQNWRLVLGFLKDTITAINRIATDTRIGLVDFSEGAYVVFNMMAYEAQRTEAMIDNMIYFGGTTNIADGLQMAREDLLPGTRSGSLKVLIVLTDGKPNVREADTIPQATLLKSLGVRIITLGITDEVDPMLLQNIASSNQDALLSPDFATLSSLVASVLGSACVSRPDPPPAPVTCNVADIALIVDSSGSIQERDAGNWNLVLQFLETVIRDIMRGRDVRFGLVDFSNTAYVVFDFQQYRTVNELIPNVRKMTYFGGTTNIAEGLRQARVNLFNNVRPGAVGIALLLTDGKPNERVDDTLPEAFSLKGIGVRIVPVGVTDEIDLALLENIANNPRDVITSTDFNSLASQIDNIIGVACGPGTPAPQFCTGSDVMLAIDSSGSIEENGGDGNWEKVLALLDDIITTIDNEGEDVSFGLVEFSNDGQLIFNLEQRALTEVIRLTRAMPYLGGRTNIADALQIAREQILPSATRPTAAKMLILITDGKPNERENDTVQQARLLKDQGVRVVVIGVTQAVDQDLLREIATSPDDVFLSPNFQSLSQEIRELVRVLCLGASRNRIN